MGFGNNLKLIRKEKNLTQEQLAEMLEVSRQAVSKWESDSGYPETEKLLMMAEKLDVSLDFLMGHTPQEQLAAEETKVAPFTEARIIISVFDGSQSVNCLSVKYSKIAFPASHEPAYILEGIDQVGFFGAHTVILGWYEDEASVKQELEAIFSAMNSGDRTYTLKYFTDVTFSFWGRATRKDK